MKIAHCLVVEDHQHARAWLREVVEQAFPGVEVTEAATLEEALVACEQNFDLALLDIGLPDGTGLDLVAPLTEKGAEVVISSVFTDDESLVTAIKRGAKGYVHKDHPKKQLQQMLEGILQGQPPLSPEIARRLLQHFVTEGDSEDGERAEDILTTRERDVLTLLAKGYTVREVSQLLEISQNTAAGYAKTIYRKLNVTSRAEATLEASRLGMV